MIRELNNELNHIKSCLMHEVMEGTLTVHKTSRYLNGIEELIILKTKENEHEQNSISRKTHERS